MSVRTMGQLAQYPIDQIYLLTRCSCHSPPTRHLEEQGTSCRAGRPVHLSKLPTPFSEEQLKCVCHENFTNRLNGGLNEIFSASVCTLAWHSSKKRDRGINFMSTPPTQLSDRHTRVALESLVGY